MEITERIDDLVEDRDRWRAQAEHVTRLLTDQRPTAQSDAGPEPRRRRKWWPW
jgi:hypothetical protein